MWVVEELVKENVPGSLRLSKDSGKSFHTVSRA